MKYNLFGRITAILAIAFCMASPSMTFGQKITPLTDTKATQLLSTGEAGILRTKVLSSVTAKLGKLETTETITITENRKTVVCEIASQWLTSKTGDIEQITASFTENGITQTINLVQYANGTIGRLEGNNLVTYSLSNAEQQCLENLVGEGSACDPCRTKINNCRVNNNRVVGILACFLRKIDSSCILCGVSYYLAACCILGTP